MKLGHWDPDTEGELSEAGFSKKLKDLGYTLTRFEYPVGTTFPPHKHNEDKIDGILAGRFRVTIDGHVIVLKPGDYICVPRNMEHSAEVVGHEAVISFDGVRQH